MALPEVWFLRDGQVAPALNMARDVVLLDALVAGEIPGAVRMYQWSSPAVSVGRHQPVAHTVNIPFCATHGIPIVRRPSGGRGVLHGHDLTIALVLPLALLPPEARSVCASHGLIATAVGEALYSLGFPCRLGTEYATWDERSGDCFAHRTTADLVFEDGTKAAGGAQARGAGFLLEQLSIPLGTPPVSHSSVFRGPTAAPDGRLASVPLDRLVEAIRTALESALSARCTDASWPAGTVAEAARRADEFIVDSSAAL